MDLPKDTPAWAERLFTELEEKVERELAAVSDSDQAMKASGAMKLWRSIKDELELEYKTQLRDIKQRNERLNARESN